MAETQQLDQLFHVIMDSFVQRGQAPHFTEIARTFSVPPEEGKHLLQALMGTGIPAWLFPDTDLLVSFAPFSNLPTQYRITVEGQQKWFGQWGLEALAVCWLFPGKAIQIEAPCLDCGEPVRVVVQDGVITSQEPTGIYGYVDIPYRNWRHNLPYTWSRINLFQSEAHARQWSGFTVEAEAGLLSLTDMMTIMSNPFLRERLSDQYISSMGRLRPQHLARLREVTHNHPFWAPNPS